jgi:hypothetical protein
MTSNPERFKCDLLAEMQLKSWVSNASCMEALGSCSVTRGLQGFREMISQIGGRISSHVVSPKLLEEFRLNFVSLFYATINGARLTL